MSTDNALIMRVATEVMGWKEFTPGVNVESIRQIFNGDAALTMKGVVASTNDGQYKYLEWQYWNPLSDERFDYMDVAFKFKSAGDRVIVKMEPEGYRCCIINGDDDNFFVAVNDAGLGRAICLAALEYMEECQEVINTLNRSGR